MSQGRAIRIGCAAGFWGDTETAAPQLLAGGRLDYLVFDYLAEITMSIMAGQRRARPDGGHAHDFVTRVMRECLPQVMERGVKVVTNAGGVNPQASREALLALARSLGLSPRVALVLGDDLMPDEAALRAAGVREIDLGSELPDNVLTMNAYLGARPIARALAEGADIVITGRVADSALVLGPLMHEHGWSPRDYDRLAAGSLAGHIIECGAQATGGLFTDWTELGDYDDIGFPVVECAADGSFVLEKPPNTGGLVTPQVVYEQLLYEIGDPRAYLLPDVVCDFTDVVAQSVGDDRVRVWGARGHPPPERYKVSATYPDGFKTSAGFLIGGEDAARKAEAVGQALLDKTERLLQARGFAPFRERRIDALGAEATYGEHSRARSTREVVLRLAVRHESDAALKLMLRELPQAGTGMAPGFASAVGGRSGAMAVIRLFSFLVPRSAVRARVDIDGRVLEVAEDCEAYFDPATLQAQAQAPSHPAGGDEHRLPLIALAHGRSGDKGDHCNIGIVAREPRFVPLIDAALTEAAVAEHMRHVLDPERGRVRRWTLPGCNGWNFLLEHSLGGGGVASLRPDPQGKAFAQQLLAFEVPVPRALFDELSGGDR